jgi:stress response protein SCP2
MISLNTGQKLNLSEVTPETTLNIRVVLSHPDIDISLFGLNADRQLQDDRYFIFYNQISSPHQEILRTQQDHIIKFSVELAKLPQAISRLVFAATSESLPIARMQFGEVLLEVNDKILLSYQLNGVDLQDQKALMLFEIYSHQHVWRLGAVGQGFNGGLKALLEYFGGETTDTATNLNVETKPDLLPPQIVPTVSLIKERQDVLLEKAKVSQPKLVNLIKQASISLEKRGLGEARYRVKLVLDISASMIDEFKSGSVHELVCRALALALRLDDDGEVEVYLFGIKPHRAGKVSIDNIEFFIKTLKFQFEVGTHYSPIMQLVRNDASSETSSDPALILFITDGATTNPKATIKQIMDASKEPLFWKFMGIEQGRVNFEFLEKLDDMPGRLVDNADFFKVKTPIKIPDAELFDLLVNELDTWEREARKLGIR